MTFPVPGSPSCFFGLDTLGPVHYERRSLWLSYRLSVCTGDHVRLLFEGFRRRPRQGIQLIMENRRHRMTINDQQAKGFILWADTAPPEVPVEITNAGRGGRLILYNVWEDEKYGTLLHGLNWTAMDVRDCTDGSLLIDCSDGYGLEPSFGDLVVRLFHTPVTR